MTESGKIEKMLDHPDGKVAKSLDLTYLSPWKILVLVFIPFAAGFYLEHNFLFQSLFHFTAGVPVILPLLTGIPAGIVLILHLKKGQLGLALIDMVLYVLWLTVIGLILMYYYPEKASNAILNGYSYWKEMLPWLQGSEAKESTPSQFIPEHLLHMGIVAISSLISAGMIALLFGTVLVNYMNYYVTQLMINSPTPLLMSVIGWHPWSICRVLSFITLGVVFAIPLVWMFNRKLVFNRRTIILMILAAVCLEVIDILLKIYLGNSWRDLLASNLSFTRDNYYGEP
jgi:hypothetical protein